MQVEKYNKPVMSSREIAVQAGRRHTEVLRSIRNMKPAWEKISGRSFALAEYKDEQGKPRPEYLLTKTETLYIATKFNDEARARLILRWEELETQSLPANTLDQLLQQANLELQLKIEERDRLNAEIDKYRKSIALINTSERSLKNRIDAETLNFLNAHMPIWVKIGYVTVAEFRVSYNKYVEFDKRLGIKLLFKAVEEYCLSHGLEFKKAKQSRLGKKVLRCHFFE